MKPSKVHFGTAAALVSLLYAGAASAQDFGEQGDVALGMDRVFGFYSISQHREDPDRDFDATAFSLGWGHTANPSVSHVPRFAVDVFVIDQLSIGGSLGFVSYSGDYDRGGVLLAPRVGYFIPFSKQWGFWPRGGLSYYKLDDPDETQFSLLLEGMFFFAPVPHFAFTAGPIIDLGVSGESGDDDDDFTDRVFGLSFGMLGWL